jgi:hypothetical protein
MFKFYHYNAVYEEIEIGHTTKLLIKVFRYKIPDLVLEIEEKWTLGFEQKKSIMRN